MNPLFVQAASHQAKFASGTGVGLGDGVGLGVAVAVGEGLGEGVGLGALVAIGVGEIEGFGLDCPLKKYKEPKAVTTRSATTSKTMAMIKIAL